MTTWSTTTTQHSNNPPFSLMYRWRNLVCRARVMAMPHQPTENGNPFHLTIFNLITDHTGRGIKQTISPKPSAPKVGLSPSPFSFHPSLFLLHFPLSKGKKENNQNQGNQKKHHDLPASWLYFPIASKPTSSLISGRIKPLWRSGVSSTVSSSPPFCEFFFTLVVQED